MAVCVPQVGQCISALADSAVVEEQTPALAESMFWISASAVLCAFLEGSKLWFWQFVEKSE